MERPEKDIEDMNPEERKAAITQIRAEGERALEKIKKWQTDPANDAERQALNDKVDPVTAYLAEMSLPNNPITMIIAPAVTNICKGVAFWAYLIGKGLDETPVPPAIRKDFGGHI